MKVLKFNEVVTDPLLKDAIVRDDFPGFKEDYLAIHCLIKKYNPNSIIEIGTSTGSGTNIICNAMGIKKHWWNKNTKKVFSVDVPPGTDPKIIYPNAEDGHPSKAGVNCTFPYQQLFGDSTKFDFSPYYPIEAWFIDGKHNYEYAKKDTLQALLSNPRLIIWHDMQIEEVEKAVVEVMSKHKNYELYRVDTTRVGFAVLIEVL